jgi:hypothetical protein
LDRSKRQRLTRGQAIRRLVEIGLLAQKSPDVRYQSKAKETAAEARGQARAENEEMKE